MSSAMKAFIIIAVLLIFLKHPELFQEILKAISNMFNGG